jgi:lipoprotein NlpI
MNILVLIAAIVMVESGGNPSARNGDAAGCLQIRPTMVQHFNSIGIEFTLEDRLDCDKSKEAFAKWVRISGYKNFEVIARKWNGGPKGHLKETTLNYWEKVKSNL